jgi:hypothetical protein
MLYYDLLAVNATASTPQSLEADEIVALKRALTLAYLQIEALKLGSGVKTRFQG